MLTALSTVLKETVDKQRLPATPETLNEIREEIGQTLLAMGDYMYDHAMETLIAGFKIDLSGKTWEELWDEERNGYIEAICDEIDELGGFYSEWTINGQPPKWFRCNKEDVKQIWEKEIKWSDGFPF